MFVQQHPDGINGRFKLKLSQYLEVTVLVTVLCIYYSALQLCDLHRTRRTIYQRLQLQCTQNFLQQIADSELCCLLQIYTSSA